MAPPNLALSAPDFFARPQLIEQTGRSKQIRSLASYYEGSQYDGRPEWFNGIGAKGEEVPLRERKPCIVYPLPKACCNQATRFTFGEGRFPKIDVDEAEGDSAVTESLALNHEDSETLSKYAANIVDSSRLKSAMRALLRHGLSKRTAVACLSVRRGRFAIDMPRAMDCYAEFVDPGDPSTDVLRMVWCYRFQKQVERHGTVISIWHWFRRDYTDTEVVVYADVQDEAGKEIVWARDEEQTKAHGFGFCPVVWARNLPEPTCNEIDGTSLYEDLGDEFDALNFALSQRHRGIVYFGSPQAWETGVGDDEKPYQVGRTATAPVMSAHQAKIAADQAREQAAAGASAAYAAIATGVSPRVSSPARKSAPDRIQSYKSTDVKLGIMETTGAAFDAATKHVLDVRSRILEAIDVILLDPTTVAGKGDVSAKALALMYAPLLALVDELRDCWWAGALQPILSMMFRITAIMKGVGLYIPGAAKASAILSRFFMQPDGFEEVIWCCPKMTPTWGAYFSLPKPEPKDAVDIAVKAKEAKLVTPATATAYIADEFGVVDADEESEQAEGETLTNAETALTDATKALPPGEDDAAPVSQPAADPSAKNVAE